MIIAGLFDERKSRIGLMIMYVVLICADNHQIKKIDHVRSVEYKFASQDAAAIVQTLHPLLCRDAYI